MRTARRRVLTTLAALLLVLVAAEGAVRAVADHLHEPLEWNSYEVQNKAERMRALGRADIVLLGSSSMNAAADPSRLKAFNAALNGADMRTIDLWLEDVVLPRLHPSIVVLGTTSLELNDNGITQRDFFRRFQASEALAGRSRWTDNIERWLEDHSFVVRYRDQLRRPARLFRGDQAVRAGEIDTNGRLHALREFQARPYGLPREFARRTRDESFHRYAIGGPQLAALARVVATLQRSGIRLVLVKMPVTTDLASLQGDTDERVYERTLARFVSEHDVTFVDAAQIDATRFFVDPLHLNAAGMRRFTAMLAKVIR